MVADDPLDCPPTPPSALTREQVVGICLDFYGDLPTVEQRNAIVQLRDSDKALRQALAQQAQEVTKQKEAKRTLTETILRCFGWEVNVDSCGTDGTVYRRKGWRDSTRSVVYAYMITEIIEVEAQEVERLKVMEAELGELKLRLNCPILAPSCLVCGQVKPFAITHLEARAIGVCEDCRSASQQLAAMREERDEAVAIAKGLTEPDEVTPADIDKVTETLGMVGRLQQQLAASQARVRELEEQVRRSQEDF